MNVVVEYIIKKKYNDLLTLLSTKSFSLNENINIIQFILYLLCKNFINDNNAFTFIYIIINNNFNFISSCASLDDTNIVNNAIGYYKCLNHFKKYIYIIKQYELTHNILKTYRYFSDVYLRLLIIIYNFSQTDGNIKKLLSPLSFDSFYKLIIKLYNEIKNLKSKTFIENVEWDNYYKCYDKININIETMHNNLMYIVNNMGEKLLLYIGVNTITNMEFEKMKYNKKLMYYNSCINKIEKFLKYIIIDYKKKVNLETKHVHFNILKYNK